MEYPNMKYPKGEELKAAWKAAKSIDHWYMTHKGKPWTLEWVDTKMEAYGDWPGASATRPLPG